MNNDVIVELEFNSDDCDYSLTRSEQKIALHMSEGNSRTGLFFFFAIRL